MTLKYICAVLLICLGGSHVRAGEVAMVMSVQGKVARLLVDAGAVPVEAFVKLNEGDKLSLETDTRLRVVYFDNGRQETWAGPGRLEMTLREGKASGLSAAEVKSLPLVMARQLARTPALDGQSRGGVTRLRSVGSQDAMARLEDAYRDIRSRTAPNDLGPEMYLLSGLYEMRELDRVERVIGDLQKDQPKNPEAALLIALYRKAIKNARENKK